MNTKKAIIIGAGPAGLTAAHELVTKTDIQPIILEASPYIGGLAKTLSYQGNRFDIGPHRFFSKSDQVMNWWKERLPNYEDFTWESDDRQNFIQSRGQYTPGPDSSEKGIFELSRLTRIFFSGNFFDYPLSINTQTLLNLGPKRLTKMGVDYVFCKCTFSREEKSLEDFLINRFGKELYLTFFKSYTEKIWGVPCNKIPADWGAQRIKGLSITKALIHSLKKAVIKENTNNSNVETSLISQFLYPKLGAGQMWEQTAQEVVDKGGIVYTNSQVQKIEVKNSEIRGVSIKDMNTGETKRFEGDYFISSMPVKNLIMGFQDKVPKDVYETAKNLQYRDLVIVLLLLDRMKMRNATGIKNLNDVIPDNWIYIQEKDLKLGRLQVYNNWSPYMMKDANQVWLGLEYFCNKGDSLWNKSNHHFCSLGISELEKIHLLNKQDVIDSTVVRVSKAYPAYFGSYDKFNLIQDYVEGFKNLYLIGRNGMHRYNNQDHSMLTAMQAVENIINNKDSKNNIWNVNIEKDYHEKK